LSTSKSLWHFVALVLVSLVPAAAYADHAAHLMVVTGAVGQSKNSQAASEKKQTEKLLTAARVALRQGDLEKAESLLSAAEEMKPEYGVLHFGDTPRKLRADLKAAQRSAAKSPQKPSSKFKPEVKSAREAAEVAAAPAQPARQAPRVPTEVIDPASEPPLRLPESGSQMKPLLPPTNLAGMPSRDLPAATELPASNQPVAEGLEGGRRQSDFHLRAARKALAVGDVRRAEAEIAAARQLNLQYGHHDDTPDRVAAAITQFRQVSEAVAGREDGAAKRQLADVMLDQAQALAKWRDFDEAEQLVQQAQALGAKYGPFDVKPEAVLERISAARRQVGMAAQAGAAAEPLPPAGPVPAAAKSYPVAPAVYEQTSDTTQNRAAAAQEELPESGGDTPPNDGEYPEDAPLVEGPSGSEAMQLYGQGEAALRNRDTKQALELFRRAYELRGQLDDATAQRLQDHLQLLSAPPAGSKGTKPEVLLDAAGSEQAVLARQVSNDLAKKEMAAEKIREKDPKQAMEILKEARGAVEAAGLDAEQKGILTRRVDRKIADLDKYIIANRAKIELDEKNRQILDEVDRRLQTRLEVDDKLAKLVDDFNKLMDEQRFAEAEVLAKRARELDPENPLVKQLIWQNKFVNRVQRNQANKDAKEDGYYNQMTSVEEAAEPFNDQDPYQFGDAKSWEELTKSRQQRLAEMKSRRSERELEIERKLKTPVSLKFRDRPLREVLEHLATLAAINLHLDPKGLEEEGISSEQTVTIDLTQDISLKSALNLILEPLHLSYVIQNEVLKITSEQLRDGVTRVKTYDVADLVIPIPNFSPNGRFGLSAAIAEAYNMTGTGAGLNPGSAFVASQNGGNATGMIDPTVMAQINQLMPGSGSGRLASGVNQPINMGPGGMGGGAQADFDSLIELITTTVKPQTWDEVGGPGTISPFQNNLSLVISQTEDVHELIVELLEQLRRNQDLQVTIEVRFITLSDSFFERIGVDFDFNVVNTSATVNPNPNVPPRNKREIVGLDQAGNFTPDLSIPFQQESFALATPQFGTPVPVANFGFAILSDLEAFLLVEAAQGDRRSNVLQAPKVTLFNGQQASVFDQTTIPFVISVIPVVGDFAAAYQPVITVLSQGTALTVQAVISHDRRFVRLTVLPLFSWVDEGRTFQFSGSTTTTKKTEDSESTGGQTGDSSSNTDDQTTTSDGVTVQLPNFSFVSVVTTVSVPDGGTVLLGGIKRLSEGRNEFGVPILSKLPYINRLFKNVGIGRDTSSLMMMVTPRIIIQEEEEERLGVLPAP